MKKRMSLILLDESGIKFINGERDDVLIPVEKLKDFCSGKYSTKGGVFQLDEFTLPMTQNEIKALKICREIVKSAYFDPRTGDLYKDHMAHTKTYTHKFDS